jgi:hypothetical protein
MNETGLNSRMASDIHLIAAPFRFITNLFKIVAFFVVFPLVVIGCALYAAIHGGPIMDSDTWFLTKVLFCVLTPFVMGLVVACHKRSGHGTVWLTIVGCMFLSALLACRVDWNIDTTAPSFHENPTHTYTVVGGRATMTRESLLELRREQVERGLSTGLVDEQLATR